MYSLPSLDQYDLQGVRPDELAAYGDDIRYAMDEDDERMTVAGFSVAYDYCD